MAAEIKTKFIIKNIGPLEDLQGNVESSSLKIGIFASNGSGKTFMSRMFRLLEKPSMDGSAESEAPKGIDHLITLGKTNASFGFTISNDKGLVEELTLSLAKSSVPSIPATTKYLYHTFNQDYVDDNIRALDYEHSDDVQGFILGKVNIDLTEDNKKRDEILKEQNELRDKMAVDIDTFVGEKVAPIRDIRRIGEYKQLMSAGNFLVQGESRRQPTAKSFAEYVADYDKVKAVPEDLQDIGTIPLFSIDQQLIDEMDAILAKAYSLSHFADEFKAEMKARQAFIEQGLGLMGQGDGHCPFCKQTLGRDSLTLIDQYNSFLTNEEAKTIKRIQYLIQAIDAKRTELRDTKTKNTEASNLFNKYKTQYIPSCENESLTDLDLKVVDDCLVEYRKALETKLTNISAVVSITLNFTASVDAFNRGIASNNGLIEGINKKKDAIGNESREIRRNICRAAYNLWIDKYGESQKKYVQLGADAESLKVEIEKKQSSQKIAKKKVVAESIRQVLDYFFAGKYKLDDSTFRLVFQSKTLEKNQAKNVLSEGEKNIIAFAYYLGDTHTIIEKEEDYEKLFFVIDDPISSMDFNYVYTMAGLIRDLKDIFPKMGDKVRFLVLTHSSDFIRILDSNNILNRIMLLKNGSMQKWKDNFTVPYINHLLDIYRVARKGQAASHTTANSVRHIIETIDRFENIDSDKDSVKEFVKHNIGDGKKVYTYINDLSHGGWRTEQPPMTEDDNREMCEAIVKMVERKFPCQIKYCEENS